MYISALKNIKALKLGYSTNVGLIIFLGTLGVKLEKSKREAFETLFKKCFPVFYLGMKVNK